MKARNREQMMQAQRSQNYIHVRADPFQKIRRVEFSDYGFMGFGPFSFYKNRSLFLLNNRTIGIVSSVVHTTDDTHSCRRR
jgi:hypothetical protein